jgi:hypothetical protein
MQLDLLVLQTFGRLTGIRSFLDLLDGALPRSEWSDNEALKQRAEKENWEFNDFDVERQVLDVRFRFWLPRYAAYSAVSLLYTVLETQLAAAAKRACAQMQASFQPTDVRGAGIEAAALYLERLGVYDIRHDPAWQKICDLRDLRHLIVHRAGTKGESEKHRQTAQRLAGAYGGRVVFPDRDWSWYGEVWVSILLCYEFVETVEAFFDRVFDALHLPPRYQRSIQSGAG